ncbi:MAG TPA: hypothetical protein VIU61_08475 [Kofleriaceae bacterium]
MTTIDNDKLVTVAGGVTMGPNGEGCIRLPFPRPRPEPGLPGPRDPFGPALPGLPGILGGKRAGQ